MSLIRLIRGQIGLSLVCLLLFSLLISTGSAATLSVQNLTIAGSGNFGSSALILDSVPQGLAGFKINASMDPVGVARPVSVTFPAAFSAMKSNTSLPADQVRVVGVDLTKAVEAGASNVTLCTFTLQGESSGSAGLLLSVGELTDDTGSPIGVTITNATVTVGSATPTPTPSPTPTSTPTVTPTQSPTVTPTPSQVDFSANPRSGTAPLSVDFTPQVNGSVAGYIWSFGDGASSNQTNPSHVYAAGTYPVSLMVTFTGGSSSSTTKQDYIVVSGIGPTPVPTGTVTPTPTPTPLPLVANFTAAPQTGVPPLAVQFTDLSEGSPVKWRWNFGDGSYSTSKNPLHIYGGIGRYTVTLEVENLDTTAIVRKTAFVKTIQ